MLIRILAPLAGLACAILSASFALAAERVLHETKSKYSDIRVIEDAQGFRVLELEKDGTRQSVVKLGDPNHLEIVYTQIAVLALAAGPEPRKVLMIGLGGGSLPMYFRRHRPDLTIDVVDIDAEVIAVAKSHFGFREDAKLRAFAADGRAFTARAKPGEYDIVIVDAFSARYIPFPLVTEEFMRAAHRALSPGGVIVSNVWTRAQNRFYDSMVRTYRATFSGFAIVAVNTTANHVFFAWKDAPAPSRDALVERAQSLARELKPAFDLPGLVASGYRTPEQVAKGGRVLRDRDAPRSGGAGH